MKGEQHIAQPATEKLTIVPLTADRYEEWDRFCLESPDAWFWQTTKWLEYSLHYRPELQSRSVSFMCLSESSPVAVCPLIVETRIRDTGSNNEFSFGGDAGPSPALAANLSERMRKEVLQRIFAFIDELAGKLKVARSIFRMSPLATSFWKASIPQPNPFLSFGFSDISLSTQVIDLLPDESQLLREMRKGHRADITRGNRLLQTTILNKQTISPEAFERYRLLHQKAAGRVTRPRVTFEMTQAWIESGLAILAVANLEGRDVGFALVTVYKDGAYYGSSCEDPEFNHLPIGHVMQWRILQWLKENGFRRYEIGIQVHASQPHTIVSGKEVKIAFFKRGFGGVAVPLWRAEKFYDVSYCFAVLQERNQQYSATVLEPAQA